MERATGMLEGLMGLAKADSAFRDIQKRYAGSGISSWVTEEEQSLLFGVGAFASGLGSIVEIGSFEGGSACFLAAGIARRGRGRLTCIDPFLGAPPWLGTAPHQRTLETFRRGTRHCGLADWIDIRVGDSPAVAAVWPATPLDAVFIDGDHSFLGALRDFECWAPKLNANGLLLIDNADDPGVPEVKELAQLVDQLGAFQFLGSVGNFGNAVFRRNDLPVSEMMSRLSKACAARRLYRPWDLSPLHEKGLPANFLKSKDWTDGRLDEPYQIGFLARCGPGEYGFTASSSPSDRAILRALSKDRGDGNVVEIGGMADKIRSLLRQPAPQFRVILCGPNDVERCAALLHPGGLMLARIPDVSNPEVVQREKQRFYGGGLKGSVLHESLLFGIWQPNLLNPESILDHAMNPAGSPASGPRILKSAS